MKIRLKASVTDLGDGKQSVSLSSVEGSDAQGSASFTVTLGAGDEGFVTGKTYSADFAEVDEPAQAAAEKAAE